MAKVIITIFLREETYSKFKERSEEIFLRMKKLEDNPLAGKLLGNVGGIVIKELRYEKFGFYFITDGRVLKFGSPDELAQLIIKFVRISDKKDQQKVITQIKEILKSLGFEAL